MLDLLRLSSRRRQPGPAPAAGIGTGLGGSGVGVGLAREPSHSLQPGVGRPRRPTVVDAETIRLVGINDVRLWVGAARARLSRGHPARLTEPPSDAEAEAVLGGRDPFIMQSDGKAWLFVPAGLKYGPLPTHYELFESPVSNPLYRQQANPAIELVPHPANPANPTSVRSGADAYPFVLTTYRLTEHHTAGAMSRTIGRLSALQP